MTNQRIVINGEEWELNSWFKRDSEYLSANFKPVPKPKPDPFAEVVRILNVSSAFSQDQLESLLQLARAIVEVCKKECGK